MGNSLGIISDDDDLFDIPDDGFRYNVINLTVDAMDVHFRQQNNHPINLPVCEKPNVDTFQVSMKLIKFSLFAHNQLQIVTVHRYVQTGESALQHAHRANGSAMELNASPAKARKWPCISWQQLFLAKSTTFFL